MRLSHVCMRIYSTHIHIHTYILTYIHTYIHTRIHGLHTDTHTYMLLDGRAVDVHTYRVLSTCMHLSHRAVTHSSSIGTVGRLRTSANMSCARLSVRTRCNSVTEDSIRNGLQVYDPRRKERWTIPSSQGPEAMSEGDPMPLAA